MSKSKSLVVVPSFDVHVAHIRDYHRLAMNSAAQTACAAAMAGLELQKVKVALKKNDTGVVFTEWVEKHEDELGITLRTAQRYMALAQNLKGKLLKEDERSVVALMDKAPSELSPAQIKRLLETMHKSIDGQSLSELYKDFGITRDQHGKGLKNAIRSLPDSSAKSDEPPTEQMILPLVYEPWKAFVDNFHAPWKKVGNTKIKRYAALPVKERKKMLQEIIDIKAELEESLKGEKSK